MTKAYPAYRKSGHEWFDELPAHWEVWKLAHAIPEISSGTTPATTDEHYYGLVAYSCRFKCSFRPPGVRRPRGLFLPMLNADGAGYRSR